MARIEFHFNAPGLLPYACRLLRKIHLRGLRAQVTGPQALLEQLDQQLWTFSALDFLPHCNAQASAVLRKNAAVLLSEQAVTDWHRQVLVNLGESVPQGFEEF